MNGLEFVIQINENKFNKELYDNLYYNLNNWRRVAANPREPGPADYHFYEEVFNEQTLNTLSEITGDYYPHWRTCEEVSCQCISNGAKCQRCKNTGLIKHYFGVVPPKWHYCPVGLRFVDDEVASIGGGGQRKKSFINKKGQEDTTIRVRRHKQGCTIFIPQIIVTIRPHDIYRELKNSDRYSATSGTRGRRMVPSKVVKHPKWREIEFIPLRVHLPISTKKKIISVVNGSKQDLRPTKESAYHASLWPEQDPHDKASDRQRVGELIRFLQRLSRKFENYDDD